MPKPEERILEVAPLWKWGGRGPITDPIDMDFKLEDLVINQLTVVRLETAAELYQSLHQGFAKAAEIMAKTRG
jgi:hypothetical protein